MDDEIGQFASDCSLFGRISDGAPGFAGGQPLEALHQRRGLDGDGHTGIVLSTPYFPRSIYRNQMLMRNPRTTRSSTRPASRHVILNGVKLLPVPCTTYGKGFPLSTRLRLWPPTRRTRGVRGSEKDTESIGFC